MINFLYEESGLLPLMKHFPQIYIFHLQYLNLRFCFTGLSSTLVTTIN